MTTINELVQQRARLQQCSALIKSSMGDIAAINRQGFTDATCAGARAAVMLVTGVLKIGPSAADNRAAIVFSGIDSALGKPTN
jgi:hypothetical protein